MNKKNLRIANIVSFTFPFIGSGIGNVALFQAEYLTQKNHKVTLISSNIPQTRNIFIRNNVNFIKVNALNFLYEHNVPVPLFLFPKNVINVIKKADVIHIHDIFYPASFFAVIFAHIYKKPVFLTQHIPYIDYSNALLNLLQKIAFYTIGKYILWYSSRIFYFNSEVGNILNNYQNKMVFLPNGINISLFHPVNVKNKISLRKKYNLPTNKVIILFVGRLVPKKGFELLYGARSKKYFTVFVGGGVIPSKFTDRENVAFLGEKLQTELSELYQLSDLFVLPSHSEGYPLSVQEAMATGLPVIVSNLQCYVDAKLNRKYVKFITPTVNNIQRAILKVISKPNTIRKMSRYSRSYMLKSHTWEKHADTLLRAYKEILL